MKPTFSKWLLAVSLAANAGTLGAVLYQQSRAHGVAPIAASAPLHLPDYLQLSDAQRMLWQQLEPLFLQDVAANWADIRQHREALVRAIFAATPDPATVSAQQARIAALQDAQQRRVIAQLLAERELLDAKQRDKLMELLLSRYAQESTEEEQLHREK